MITGKENILKFVRFNNAPFWRIRRSEKTQIIADSGDKPLTIDESLTRLEQAFQIMGAGTYFIEAWESEGQKKMWFSDTIQILPENLQSAYVGAMNQLQTPQIDVQAEIQKGIEIYANKLKLEAMELKIKALETERDELLKQNDSFFTRVYDRVEPFLGQILDMNPPKLATASIGSNSDNDQKRLEKAFDEWQKNETKVVEIVEAIAKLSSNKMIYPSARAQLLKMA